MSLLKFSGKISLFLDLPNMSDNHSLSYKTCKKISENIANKNNCIKKCVFSSGDTKTIERIKSIFGNDYISKFELKDKNNKKETLVDELMYSYIMGFVNFLSEKELKNHTVIFVSGDGKAGKDGEPSIIEAVKYCLKKCSVVMISWKRSINNTYIHFNDVINNFRIIYLDDIQINFEQEILKNKIIQNVEQNKKAAQDVIQFAAKINTQSTTKNNILKRKRDPSPDTRSNSRVKYNNTYNYSNRRCDRDRECDRYMERERERDRYRERERERDCYRERERDRDRYNNRYSYQNQTCIPRENTLSYFNPLYKTKICHFFDINGCYNGDRCHFAHGTHELRKSN